MRKPKIYTADEITALCAQDREYIFYGSKGWKHLRDAVLDLDHHECQRCKELGRYTPATTVHHVKHLKDRPDLAYSIYDGDDRQLISLCASCHDHEHPEKLRRNAKAEPLTPERW